MTHGTNGCYQAGCRQAGCRKAHKIAVAGWSSRVARTGPRRVPAAPPDPFTFHDLSLDGVDFRELPHPARSFDTACFDPPYVPAGGTSQLCVGERFRVRYGIDREVGYGKEQELADLILGGLAECARVARAFVLVKCMEFVSSRRFHDWPVDIAVEMDRLGWVKHDVIVHNTGPGPGGHNIFEVLRARRAHSYLLVFSPSQEAG